MSGKRTLTSVGIAIMVLALLAGLAAAQGPEAPEGEISAEGTDGAAAAVAPGIPVQGRLTDAGGNPLAGNFSIRFRLYADDLGTTVVCEDTNSVTVENGLFFSVIWGTCTSEEVDGHALYLGIQVGADPEMRPLQALYAVPYAYSLRPGAIINATLSGDAVVHIENSGTTGRAIRAYATALTGENFGVVGASRSPDGQGGYFYNTGNGVALHADSAGVAVLADGSGVIQSTAKSYLWIGGNGVRPYRQSDSTVIDMDSIGGARITRGATAGNKNVMLPIAIPGPLYGQNVTISGMDIYWVGDTEFDAISAVLMRRQTGVCASASCYANILYDTADHVCDYGNFPTGCKLHYDLTSNNVLTADSGILYLTLELAFSGSTTWVEIGGVRLTLEHN